MCVCVCVCVCVSLYVNIVSNNLKIQARFNDQIFNINSHTHYNCTSKSILHISSHL